MTSVQTSLRSYGRRIGLHRVVYRIFDLLGQRKSYEPRLMHAVQESVCTGDVVWDVGANVGVFTALFCDLVGASGRVVAFEPNPFAANEIGQRLSQHGAHLHVVGAALGAEERTVPFVIDPGYSPRSHIAFDGAARNPGEFADTAIVRTGDNISAEIGRPNVVKIDVEGFEDDALAGMREMLRDPALRIVFVEVHYQFLEDRGRADAPARIKRLLKESGFELKWIDPNHLKAFRPE